MENVFEKLALYRRRGANTLLVRDCIQVFLKSCDIVLKNQKAAGSLWHKVSEFI